MRLSVLLYGGFVLMAGGVLLLTPRRTRRIGTRALIAGLAAAVIALAWPSKESRVVAPRTRIDEFMPAWQLNEVHTTHVDAPPGRVFDATHAVAANEILFFRTLIAIRRGWRNTPESILHAPANEPLLDVATRTSFSDLADERPREILVQTKIARGVNAGMNFLITSDGRGGSNVSTETRVFADSAAGARQFAVYWRLIHPGSDVIRRMWLRAIKRRAELN